jgi:hypothetical protein
MLELRVTGDTHPKTFTLVTDDRDAELIRLQEIIHDEIEAGSEDPIRKWFDAHTADEFAAGVVVPTDFIGEFGELLESDWFDEAMKVEKERESMIADLEAKDG